MRIVLPEKGTVPITGDEDPLIYYYLPLVSHFYRMRLKMPINLMRGRRFRRLLDIGYGSGIFYLELARYADELHGVDIHTQTGEVTQALKKFGLDVMLKTGDILDLPYPDGRFDAVVCVSVMEHIRQLDRAVAEMKRILSRDGLIVFGFPVRNRFTSSFYASVGFDYQSHHPSDHRSILRALEQQLVIERCITYPEIVTMDSGLYVSCRCRRE